MKVLITGGAGFLGLHLAKYFNKQNWRVSILDIEIPDKAEYPDKITFIKGDIRDNKLLEKVTKNMDVIVHAAAALPLWKAKEIYDININGTENVLKAALSNKVKRVVYISSTAVYGVPKKHPIFEDDPRVGVGPYGESKIAAEDLCFKFIKKGLNVTIIRPKTFLGTHRLGVFEILFDWIHDNKKIPLIGNGNNRYELLDVDDLCEAIYLFIARSAREHLQGVNEAKTKIHLEGEAKLNGAFNIGAEKFQTVKKDLEEVFAYAGEQLRGVNKANSE